MDKLQLAMLLAAGSATVATCVAYFHKPFAHQRWYVYGGAWVLSFGIDLIIIGTIMGVF